MRAEHDVRMTKLKNRVQVASGERSERAAYEVGRIEAWHLAVRGHGDGCRPGSRVRVWFGASEQVALSEVHSQLA